MFNDGGLLVGKILRPIEGELKRDRITSVISNIGFPFIFYYFEGKISIFQRISGNYFYIDIIYLMLDSNKEYVTVFIFSQ